jgi:hypothetical protein
MEKAVLSRIMNLGVIRITEFLKMTMVISAIEMHLLLLIVYLTCIIAVLLDVALNLALGHAVSVRLMGALPTIILDCVS